MGEGRSMSTFRDSSELLEAAQLFRGLVLAREPAGPAEAAVGSSLGAASAASSGFRGDRLEDALAAMCRRGGLAGAVVADSAGLPLAAHNSPVALESLAAFTSVLGEALEKAARYLGQPGADYITMDVSYQDKVVLRRFLLGERPCYLMVLCAQGTDERAEVEVSIRQVQSILTQA